MPLSSYTTTLPTDVLLDTGILYLGASIFAATRGPLTFDPAVTMRAVEFAGMRSKVAGLDRKVMTEPTISGTVIELAAADVAQIEPGATVLTSGAWTGSTSYSGKAAGTLYASGDYLTDVRAVWERGSGGLVQVRFPRAYVETYTLAGAEGEEGAISLTIAARLDLSVSGSSPSDMPYRIEFLSA